MPKHTLVMSTTFMEAQRRLPASTLSRINVAITQLFTDPLHPSLNYENIFDAKSKRIRSIRVTDDYRIILAHPDGDGVYVLLWVDKHDAAYQWARRHSIDLGDGVRGVSIVETTIASQTTLASPVYPSAPSRSSLLEHCTDEEMLQIGVPATFITPLRACQTESELLTTVDGLRAEVGEALLLLYMGEHLEASSPPTVPPATLAAALDLPESQRRFITISSERELDQALNFPLERWRLFLHPTQRAVVRRNFSGPALVSGGAGTGKSVVGIHRAYYLAHEVFTATSDNILLTTFTKNLADNLRALMKSFCSTDNETYSRITVNHIHAVAAQIRQRAGESFTIINDQDRRSLMQNVVQKYDTLSFPVAFYESEWRTIVQERDATTAETYQSADRTGRKRPLNRRQRAAIWSVFAAYRLGLQEQMSEEWPDVIRRATEIVLQHGATLDTRYRAAIVDEAQDFGVQELRFIHALVGEGPQSLLLLGDSRQQIYARGSAARVVGISIGRRHVQLRTNYRTTAQISAAAEQIDTGSLALNGETLKHRTISLLQGPVPTVMVASTQEEEYTWLVTTLQGLLALYQPEDIALLARSRQVLADTKAHLRAQNIPTGEFGNTQSLIQTGTIHKSKGLEFRIVFIVGCTEGIFPSADIYNDEEDVADEQERKLLYVAMTRARECLYICGHLPASTLLKDGSWVL